MHALLPSLRIPSDYFRAFDTVTPECGEPVLIHNIGLTDSISGKLSVLRLDLQPLTKDVEKKERCSTSAGEYSDEVCLQDALKQVDTKTAHGQQEDIL